MVENGYRYAISLYREDWTPLGQVPADADWEPAAECVRFDGIRRGRIQPGGSKVAVTVEPLWHATAGEPCVERIRVRATETGGGQAECELSTAYFARDARLASAQLVAQGGLKPGELFHYLVSAHPDGSSADDQSAPAIRVDTVVPPLPLREASLDDYMQRSASFFRANGGQIPVFFPRRVLEETADLARRAGALETGGVLIGHLWRDLSIPEIFLEVTGQTPFKQARSELTSLTLTPDTWSAANAAIALRKRGEVMVGWWHSHSFMKQQKCKDCQERAAGSCDVSPAFMSAEDCYLHRTCFPRAYSVALVVGDSPCSGLSWALFSWQAGVVGPRGFHILAAPGSGAAMEAIPAVGGTQDATN